MPWIPLTAPQADPALTAEHAFPERREGDEPIPYRHGYHDGNDNARAKVTVTDNYEAASGVAIFRNGNTL
jgi:hypothetical protein